LTSGHFIIFDDFGQTRVIDEDLVLFLVNICKNYPPRLKSANKKFSACGNPSTFYLLLLTFYFLMAHKKAGGSTQNIRDSKPKYLGVKKFGGEAVQAGNIIIRQKGMKYELGDNVYAGKDFTVHAAVDGKVKFNEKRFLKFNTQKKRKTIVSVEPVKA